LTYSIIIIMKALKQKDEKNRKAINL